MTALAEANSLPIILAALVGVLVAWWIFRSLRKQTGVQSDRQDSVEQVAPQEPPRPLHRDGPEGNSIFDEGAAAAADVSGQILGTQVHAELPSAGGPPDRLETMKGVGPKFVAKLNENRITRFDQLASLSEAQAASLDERMGPFKGRLQRDRVLDQAHYLARGDTEGFEAKFGKLGTGSL